MNTTNTPPKTATKGNPQTLPCSTSLASRLLAMERNFAKVWIIAACVFVLVFSYATFLSFGRGDMAACVMLPILGAVWAWAGWAHLNKHFMKTMTHKKLMLMRKIHAMPLIGRAVRTWRDEIGRVHFMWFWKTPILCKRVRVTSYTNGGQPRTIPFFFSRPQALGFEGSINCNLKPNTDMPNTTDTDTKTRDPSNSEQRIVRPSIIEEADKNYKGPRFLGLPDPWFDGGKVRCENGHISKRVLKSERLGRDACLGCGGHVWITFPEDEDDSVEPRIQPRANPT